MKEERHGLQTLVGTLVLGLALLVVGGGTQGLPSHPGSEEAEERKSERPAEEEKRGKDGDQEKDGEQEGGGEKAAEKTEEGEVNEGTSDATDETEAATETVIVQAKDLEAAIEASRSVGGRITSELGIIRAVAVEVTQEQRKQLESLEGIRVYENRTARTN